MKHHLKHMTIAAGALLALVLAVGWDLGRALPYAIALACPIGMIVMMVMMNRHGGRGSADSTATSHAAAQPAPAQSGSEITRDDHERLS